MRVENGSLLIGGSWAFIITKATLTYLHDGWLRSVRNAEGWTYLPIGKTSGLPFAQRNAHLCGPTARDVADMKTSRDYE